MKMHTRVQINHQRSAGLGTGLGGNGLWRERAMAETGYGRKNGFDNPFSGFGVAVVVAAPAAAAAGDQIPKLKKRRNISRTHI